MIRLPTDSPFVVDAVVDGPRVETSLRDEQRAPGEVQLQWQPRLKALVRVVHVQTGSDRRPDDQGHRRRVEDGRPLFFDELPR